MADGHLVSWRSRSGQPRPLHLPESFGAWTRVWSPFRRWSRNGIWARGPSVLHAAPRDADGRADATPSMVVIDAPRPRVVQRRSHLPRPRRTLRPYQGRQAHRRGRRGRASRRRDGRAGVNPREPRERPEAGTPHRTGRDLAARARPGGPRRQCGRCIVHRFGRLGGWRANTPARAAATAASAARSASARVMPSAVTSRR